MSTGPNEREGSEGAPADLWLMWRRANEVVRTAVLADVTSHVGIAEADLGVLIQLDKAGVSVRQNALAAVLAWDRSRLSHLLDRMQSRGLVIRTRLNNGAEVALSDEGRALLERAKPHVANASRRQIAERLGSADAATLHRILERLLKPNETDSSTTKGERAEQ